MHCESRQRPRAYILVQTSEEADFRMDKRDAGSCLHNPGEDLRFLREYAGFIDRQSYAFEMVISKRRYKYNFI